MWTDIVDLRDFYDDSLGHVVRRLIRRRIRMIWPNVSGLRVLGLGFATPYLRAFKAEAERVLAIMPSSQGVLPWPDGEPGLATMADEAELPLPDRSIDRLLLVHALESTEQVRALMREVWRVLADGGRLLVVVPNRRGIWARFERTPFGAGRPYSASQIDDLLREAMFTPIRSEYALFVPPSRSRLLIGSAPAWEKIGERWFPTFAGVLLVEASKQIYAAPLDQATAAKTRGALVMPQVLRRWPNSH